jgi:enoyl-CoA hydratase/carnithine racemase
MTAEQVRCTTADGIATVLLNRPDRLNAWTPVMERELRAVMSSAEADPSVRVIILTGAGRGFCAGLDKDLLREHARHGRPRVATPGGQPGRFTYLISIGKPVIAAINGAVAGSGLALALSCDLRFASTDAVFTTSFARRGLTAEHGLSWLLPRLVGVGNALDLLLSARRIDATEALRMGLVNRTTPPSRLIDEVTAYARRLVAECSPRSLRVIKRQVWAAAAQSLAGALREADREMAESLRSDDFQEGIAHLLEHRPPAFRGT